MLSIKFSHNAITRYSIYSLSYMKKVEKEDIVKAGDEGDSTYEHWHCWQAWISAASSSR